MLILNSAKMIYIHLQKCGGTSVEVSFEPCIRWDDVILGSTEFGEIIQWHYFGAFRMHKHSSANEVREAIGDDRWFSYYRWATVRNPFDLVCSIFGFSASLIEPLLGEVPFFPSGASARECAQWVDSDAYPAAEPWSYPAVRAYLKARGAENPLSAFLRQPDIGAEASLCPQLYRLSDSSGRYLIDEAIRLEDLEARWPALLERLGMPALPLLHANSTPAKYRIDRKQAFRDPEDVAWVTGRFEPDFTKFGYDPNPWSEAAPANNKVRRSRPTAAHEPREASRLKKQT